MRRGEISRAPIRRLLLVVCVVIATAGAFTAWRMHSQAQPCWTVRQLIEFNHTSQESLKAKTYLPPAGSYDEPRVPTDADYQAWIEGLRQRADRVKEPSLAAHGRRLADLARDFLTGMNTVNAQLDQEPEPIHVPPAAKDVARIEHEFDDTLRALDKACPAGHR